MEESKSERLLKVTASVLFIVLCAIVFVAIPLKAFNTPDSVEELPQVTEDSPPINSSNTIEKPAKPVKSKPPASAKVEVFDPLINCNFKHSGTLLIRKSDCIKMIDCQIGDNWYPKYESECVQIHNELDALYKQKVNERLQKSYAELEETYSEYLHNENEMDLSILKSQHDLERLQRFNESSKTLDYQLEQDARQRQLDDLERQQQDTQQKLDDLEWQNWLDNFDRRY